MNLPSLVKTTVKQKAALLLFGLLLGLILLEIGLRGAGFVLLYLQERDNRQSLQDKSEYVILCLGESTTAVGGKDSYPKQLDNILNDRGVGKKVTVVNKGVIGTNTTAIVSRLADCLNTYQPDMVITMMGINEGLGTTNIENRADADTGFFLRNFRVYKLLRLLWDRVFFNIKLAETARQRKKEVEEILTLAETAIIGNELSQTRTNFDIFSEEVAAIIEKGDRYFDQDKWEEAVPFYRKALESNPENTAILSRLAACLRELQRFREDREILRQVLLVDPQNPDVYIELGNSFRNQQGWEAAEVFYRKALALSPDFAQAYLEWGRSYKMQGDRNRAVEMFTEAMERDPEDLSIYMQLAHYHDTLGNYDEAEKTFKKALERDPNFAGCYAQLGRFYAWRGRNKEAEIMCKKAIELHPENELAYAELGDIYTARGWLEKAEEMYQKALDINPLNNIAFRILVLWCIRDGRFEKAGKLCKKILEINPQDDRALGMLAICYQSQGKTELAEQYFKKAHGLRAQCVNSTIAGNYQKARKLVTERGVQLVCVQYPMRNVENLKRIFPEPEGIIFVDNEDVFKSALQEGSYGDYFTDCFAGDFGHCTPAGNHLLAENIADTILPAIEQKKEPGPGRN
ncbi:MAG: tetratricopeptide repeat protein [PVC group bacterium]